MSNKLELQNNNIDLQGILTKVNTLPKKENIDEEVDTIENLTEQIKLALEGKAAGGGKIFAAIGVTYPEGSVCTCTNGTKTMEAGNTNGQWVFVIPEAGEWTVTATQGINIKSQSVSITGEGQFEDVVLTYTLIIFDGGDNTEVTGGWGRAESKQSPFIYGECAPGSWKVDKTIYSAPGNYYNSEGTNAGLAICTVYSKNPIDVTGHDTLKVTANRAGPTLRLGTSTTSDVVASESLVSGTVSLDVSSLSGAYHIQFYGGTCEVSKIVLE